MSIFQTVLIGLALAMDAFAVSVCMSAASDRLRLKNMLVIAGFFGGFQALMPYVGWQAGVLASSYISSFDHWIAFALLSYIGARMILEARKCRRCETEKRIYGDPTNISVLFMLAIATSIDALAVGVTLGCLASDIVMPSIVIGLVTFAVSLAGAALGSKVGRWAEGRIEILGGAILIAIGLKILIEHLFFG